MSVGKDESSAGSAEVVGLGTHTAGSWYVNLDIPAIGNLTANVSAYVVGTPGDGFAVELKAGYRVSGGVLSIGPVTASLPLVAFGTAAGVTADLDTDGEFVVLLVEGVDGITFDVDTFWKAWSTA